MDFGPTFPEIDALNFFEEMLIAKVATLVSVVTLTSTGYLSYQGHSVNFFQKTTEWFNTIPRRASACEMILIVRKGAHMSSKRKAFKVSRIRLMAAIKKLAEVNPHYGHDQINIDWEYLNTLPEDDVPADANVYEKQMDDFINISPELFEKWLYLAKHYGNLLLQHLFESKIATENYFSYVLKRSKEELTQSVSFTSNELVGFLEHLTLLDKANHSDNHELLIGELTVAAMELEGTEDEMPSDFGNVIHEEEEGQKTSCSRNFDSMAKSLHGIPSIDEAVVVKEGAFKNNLGLVQSHNEDGSISVFFKKAVYSGTGGSIKKAKPGEMIQIESTQHGTLTLEIEEIDQSYSPVASNILLSFHCSSIHTQSKIGCKPQQFDVVKILRGNHQGKEGCIKSVANNECRIQLLDGIIIYSKLVDVSLLHDDEQCIQSQNPLLSTPVGVNVQNNSRIPMPVFEGPMRDENPIPERESNILSCAFPKLFQTGIGDIYAPRLRALDEDGADAIQAFVHHCLYWKDNRFSKHPRFLYVLYNRMLRQKLLKTKSFYLKHRKPTPADFLPENRKKTI